MTLDGQFAAREYIDGFLDFLEQGEIVGSDLRCAAVEREANQAQDYRVALAEDSRLLVIEHPLDLLELLLDSRLSLDTLYQGRTFLGRAAQALVKYA